MFPWRWPEERFAARAHERTGFGAIPRANGLVVNWSIGTRPDAELVNTMLDAAIDTVIAGSNRPVVHSDRGGHYRWPGWLNRMADADLGKRPAIPS